MRKTTKILNVATATTFSALVVASNISVAADATPENTRVGALERDMQAMELRHQQEMQALKKRVAEIDIRAWNSTNKIKEALREQSNKLQVHGFLSAYAVKADKDVDHTAAGYEDEVNFSANTKFGVQFDYSVTDSVDAVLQMTAKGYEARNFEQSAEWGFLRYQASDDWMFRVGRMRTPTYMYSESSDIGFSYPWVRLPLDSYLLGFENYSGFNANYSLHVGGWIHEFQTYVGSNTQDTHEATVSTRQQVGLAITSTMGPWTLRVSHTDVGEVAIYSPSIDESGIEVTYSSLGMRYDDGTWLVSTEMVSYEPKDAAPILGHTSGYFMMGRHFGKWMPYLSYGMLTSTDDQEDKAVEYYSETVRAAVVDNVYQETYQTVLATTEGGYAAAVAAAESIARSVADSAGAEFDAVLAGNKTALSEGRTLTVAGQPVAIPGQFVRADMRSVTLGLRYDMFPNVAIKAESSYFYAMDGTGGNWGDRERYDESRAALGDDQQLISLGVDAVF